jgi:hypothetical protein
MDDTDFDKALITAAFGIAAVEGWRSVSVVNAARSANLPLDRARARFAAAPAILQRFGTLADQAALVDADETGSPRDRLFDLLMRRFDAFQPHRAGIIALLESLPAYPATAFLLTACTAASMAWMLEAAGLSSRGIAGTLRVKGLVAVWLYTLRCWRRDDSSDLSQTMAALDRALGRAEQIGGWLEGRGPGAAGPKPFPEPPPAPDSPASDEANIGGLDENPGPGLAP